MGLTSRTGGPVWFSVETGFPRWSGNSLLGSSEFGVVPASLGVSQVWVCTGVCGKWGTTRLSATTWAGSR